MKSILPIIFLFFAASVSAQDEIRVEYQATGKLVNEMENLMNDEQMLVISGETSKYYSIKQERFLQYQDSVCKANPQLGLMDILMDKSAPREGFKYNVYKNYPKTDVLTFTQKIGNEYYLYEEKMPDIEWHLEEGDTTILSYACQKAVACFRGRTWTAWFSPELPFSEGPWKLCGLPGLILKAFEQDGIFSFEATALEQTTAAELKPEYHHYVRCTPKIFQQVLEDLYADSVRFAMRQLGFANTKARSPRPPQSPCLMELDD